MSDPILPSMRRTLDEIAAQKIVRDAATAHAEEAARAAIHERQEAEATRRGAEAARWQRLEDHLAALRQEAAEQTRLLREILAALSER
jgi:hypothetical protein